MSKVEKIKIDNAGIIYPCSATKDYQSIHRISVDFYDEIDVEKMQKALEKVIKRFPSFQVKLKKGFFWNYFIKTDEVPKIEVTEKVCQLFNLKNGLLFRIICNYKTLAIETFHGVADGSGSFRLFNTLIATYLKSCGANISSHPTIYNLDDSPTQQETTDDFQKFFDPKGPRNNRKEDRAYQIAGEEQKELSVCKIKLNLDRVKMMVEDTNYNLNDLILAIYFESMLQEKQLNAPKDKKPIKLAFPSDLRHFYGNKTLKNFSGYINLRVDSQKSHSFEDLLETMKTQTEVADKNFYQHNINANVAIEKNFFVRNMPRFLKDMIISYFYSNHGECLYTSVFSNMGKASTPIEFNSYIENYECLVGANKVNTKCLCCIGYKNNLNLTITGKIKENTLENIFIENLKKYALL